MSIVINSAYPRVENLGTNDLSRRILPAATLSLPQYLPKVFIMSDRGSTKPMLVTSENLIGIFGDKMFDASSAFYKHTTKVLERAVANGTICVVHRLVDPAVKEKANVTFYLDILKKGVYAYIIRTSDKDNVSISFTEMNIKDDIKDEKDKWDNWAFRVSISGSINGEETYTNSSYYGSLTANRITAESKFTTRFSLNSNVSKYEYDDISLVTEQKSKYANMTYVKSKGDHFSIGAKANYMQSTSKNYDGNYKFSPCIEYNIFPYSESSEHRMSFLYGISANHNDYTDTTVYLKTSENFASHLLDLSYQNSQTWGSFSFSIYGDQILDKDDLKKYNVGISSNIDWNITKGLSLNYWAYINFDRAQIHLPLDEATYEEIILRQKELESNYFYYMNFGISYTFGSMKNNVVNPRFD